MFRLRLISLTISVLSILAAPAFASAATSHRPPLAAPIQWRTTGGQYPDATDPTRLLSPSQQRTFQCIRFHESRNHLVDGDGSQGWYQFTRPIWDFARRSIHGLPPTPNLANGDQQSAVAVFYLERNGRFGVEWAAESATCPGRF